MSQSPAPRTTLGFWPGVWLVAEREIRMQLRSKAYIISSLILIAIVFGGVIFGGLRARDAAQDASEPVPVAVEAAAAAQLGGAGEGWDVTEVSGPAEAEQLVRDGSVDAAIVADASAPTGIAVIADSEAPERVLGALTLQPSVTLLDPPDPNYWLNYLVTYGFALVFFAAAMTFGSTIAQSVVEEKQTRVIEILMSAVPVRVLLAGKVIGDSILAFGQTALTVAGAIVGLAITGQDDLLDLLGAPMVWFIAFFLVGFVLIAALFAATGSMVSRQEDIGSTTTPVTMLVALPFVGVILAFDSEIWMRVLSYFPFSSPVAMPVRMFQGTAAWWEPVLSMGVLVATTVLAIWGGSVIYRNSLLRMGSVVKLRDALRGAR